MRLWKVTRSTAALMLTTVILALVIPVLPAAADPAPPPPPTPQQEAFRASVQQMISGLTDVVSAVQSNPRLAPSFKVTGTDPSSMIAAAHDDIAKLSSTGLDALQAALAAYPSWLQMPSSLLSSVAAFTIPAKASAQRHGDSTATFTDHCDSAGSAPDEFIATLAANQAQSIANAAMMAAPGTIPLLFVSAPTGVKIALAVTWGVVNATYLALAQTLAVSTDCATTAFAATQTATYPRDPADSSTIVQGSSQVSVTKLIALATDTRTEISNVLNTVKAVDAKADTLTTAGTNLNKTLNDTNTRTSEVQSDLQSLQASVVVLENTQLTVLNKANLEITNLATFQQLQVRMEIEANLSRPSYNTGAVALFQLPKAFGGYLETVRSIVGDVVAKQTAVGHGNALGPQDLNTANAEFAAGHYKHAYQLYTKAYTDVTKP